MSLFKKIIYFIFFTNTAFAASGNVQKEGNDILNTQLGIGGNSSNIQFKNESISSGTLINYESNSAGRLGLSFGYRNLGLGISTSASPGDTHLKGESTFQDYSLRLLGRNTFNLGYQYTKGFYVKGSANPTTGIYDQRPDMTVKKSSFSWMHNFFHEDLSLPAVFSYSGWQEKSGWTILSFVQLNNSAIEETNSLITPSQSANFPVLNSYKKIERSSASAGVGLAGAVVYQGFQIGILLTVGSSVERKVFTDTSGQTNTDSSASAPINLFVNGGYNGKKHQLGLSFFSSSYNTKLGSEVLDDSSNEIRVFYGYRFGGVNLGGLVNSVSGWLD